MSELVQDGKRLQNRLGSWLGTLGRSSWPGKAPTTVRGYDLNHRKLQLPGGQEVELWFLGTLVDERRLWEEVVQPLLSGRVQPNSLPGGQVADQASQRDHLLLEGCVLLADGATRRWYAISLPSHKGRSVDEPSTETVIMGPKEGMVEDLDTNVTLVRQRLRDPRLRVRRLRVGRRSRTSVAVLYLKDVANRQLVQDTLRGLGQLAVDQVRSTADIASLLYAASWTPFPLAEQTERADRVANALAEGRVALLVAGNPFAILAPVTVMEFLRSSESDLLGPAPVVFARVLRILGLATSVSAGGLYVALTSVNLNVLPLRLAISVNSTRFGVPFPPLTETLLALLIGDVLVEATAQAGKGIGNALTVVGTLIIGQMVVQARLSSSLLMVVVAVTVLGGFLTTSVPLTYALRIWKYVFVLLAGLMGIAGWMGAWILLVAHLSSLKSGGVPYLSPLAPLRLRELWRPLLVGQPLSAMPRRPRHWRPQQTRRTAPEARR